MVIEQGDIWWAELGDPVGSTPVYRRPVLVVQADAFNQSRIGTIVCVPLTSNLKWSRTPGNVVLTASETGLDRDSVTNCSGIAALDREQLTERVGKVLRRKLELVLAGVDVVLGP